MKKTLRLTLVITLLIYSGLSLELRGQKLTEDFIKAWVLHLDSASIDLIDKTVFIVDGLPVSLSDEHSELSEHDFDKERIELSYISPEKSSSFNHRNGPVIVLVTNTRKQKRKELKKRLAEARELYADPVVKTSHGIIYKKEPVVVLDGEILDSPTSKAILSDTYLRSFETILVSYTAPPALYGENAKNGLVRIWSKK